MGKTRGLFKKIGDTKETFHTRMGIIKIETEGPNRSRRDKWIEAEEINGGKNKNNKKEGEKREKKQQKRLRSDKNIQTNY